MHIPDKYRDRYDRLAASHPWMREMRDEDARDDRSSYEERLYDVKVSDCPYCGCDRVVIHEYNDAYERPNSYRVEHVDDRKSFNCGCFESYYGFDSIEKAVEHADMRDGERSEHPKQIYVSAEDFEWLQEQLDGEPTNGIGSETNGIADETNGIADEITLPDGDVVEVLRRPLYSISDIGRAIGVLEADEHVGGSGDACYILRTLADMVERDYVSRETHSKAADIWQATCYEWEKCCGKLEAERDELKKRVDEQQETLDVDCRDLIEYDNEICKLRAERDELKAFSERLEHAAHDKLGVTLFGVDYVTEDFMLHVRDTLTAERDELKAMNERLQVALDAVEGCDERCKKLETERDEWKVKANCIHDYGEYTSSNPFVKEWTCRKCGHETLIEPVQVERDEWKAKAEQAQESYLDAKSDRDAWIEKFKDAEHAMNAAAGKWAKADDENRELRKMLLLDDGTVEEYTERANPLTAIAYQKQLAEEWRDRCHNAEALCDKIEAERDELNAKLGSGTCELHYGEDDDGVDGWYTHCGGWFAATRKDRRLVRPLFCQLCGKKAVKK